MFQKSELFFYFCRLLRDGSVWKIYCDDSNVVYLIIALILQKIKRWKRWACWKFKLSF